jgi:hypothetical protein
MKSKHIAESGISISLVLVILYATSILPISTLSILTIASCLIPITIIRTSVKNAILVYIVSSILSFFLVQTKIAIYFTLFFGIYGIIKYFVEKIRNIPIELFFKLITFNLLLIIIYFTSTKFLGGFIIELPLRLILAISQVIFLIYDYALTIIISYYLNKLNPHI